MPIINNITEAAAFTPKKFVDAYFDKASTPDHIATDSGELADFLSQDNLTTTDLVSLQSVYTNIESLLVCEEDWLAGIETRKLTTPEEFTAVGLTIKDYPTGVAYYRDATNLALLKGAIDPQDLRYARNELLQRSLNIVRGIDYAFSRLAQPPAKQSQQVFYNGLRCLLANRYSQLLKACSELTDALSIKELEAVFNTDMAAFLHDGGLDEGIKKKNAKKSYDTLLAQYRFYATTLQPAAAMVSRFKDPIHHVEFTKIALPVTEKTEEQKKQLAKMKVSPSGEKNYHTAQPPAIRLAQTLFADRLMDDKTILAPQLRRTIAPGIKNGYTTALTVMFEDETVERYAFGRSGSLVYMGEGEPEEALVEYASESLTQMEQAGARASPQFERDGSHRLHSTLLNTHTAHEKEDKLIEISTKALEQLGDLSSNVPVNAYGTLYSTDVAPELKAAAVKVADRLGEQLVAMDADNLNHLDALAKSSKDKRLSPLKRVPIKLPWFGGFLHKKARALFAGAVAFAASTLKNVFSIFSCFSGQDRTSAQAEIVGAICIKDAYAKHNITLEFNEALDLDMQDLSGRFLPTLAAPGSLGIKGGNVPKALFGEKHFRALELPTARTAKHAPVHTDVVKAIAKRPRLLELNKVPAGNFVLKMKAVDVVVKALSSYEKARTGIISGLMASQDLLDRKLKEVRQAKETISTHSSGNQSTILTFLYEELKALKKKVQSHTKKVNEYDFFHHKSGRLEKTIDCCLNYIEKMRAVQETGLTTRSVSAPSSLDSFSR